MNVFAAVPVVFIVGTQYVAPGGVGGHRPTGVETAFVAHHPQQFGMIEATNPVARYGGVFACGLTQQAAQVSSFSANPESASLPATIQFVLKTTAEVTSIRLMNEQGYAMPAAVQNANEGDGILWTYQVTMDTAYEGNVYAYVRDQNGAWLDGGVSCKISVK